MNKLSKILMAAALVGTFAACDDLDTAPLGGSVTSEQKIATLEVNPAMAGAGVNAIYKQLITFGANFDVHTDYGYPSIMLMADSRAADLFTTNNGYNWYSANASFGDWNNNYYANLILYYTLYKTIYCCNSVTESILPETDNADLMFNRAQALCYRALCYSQLAPRYQFTYDGNQDKPDIVLITDVNKDQVAIEGAPRSTVKEVYDLVLADLQEGIDLLEKAQAAGVTPANKSQFSLAAAYGLRARVRLVTTDWAGCAADAQKCIDLAAAEGCVPTDIEASSKPAFCDSNEPNWLLGCVISADLSYTGGVTTITSFLSSWSSNGYTGGAGDYQTINKKLYNIISNTDSRKNWFCNGSAIPPSGLPQDYKDYISSGKCQPMLPYSNVKFGCGDPATLKNAAGSTWGANDYPILRIEEVYLTLAEAQAHQSMGTATATLNTFVQTYRDPEYKAQASNVEEFTDECWNQRRIELWGEGMAWYDIMRLKKNIDRRGTGIDPQWVFAFPHTEMCMIYEIVYSEANSNPLIGDTNNGAINPTPVPDN